jgi:hypothetical protein
MTTITNGRLALVCAVCFAAGCWFGYGNGKAAAAQDRPVLRAIARVAKLGLWMMFLAESSPPAEPAHVAHIYRHHGGDQITHREGW